MSHSKLVMKLFMDGKPLGCYSVEMVRQEAEEHMRECQKGVRRCSLCKGYGEILGIWGGPVVKVIWVVQGAQSQEWGYYDLSGEWESEAVARERLKIWRQDSPQQQFRVIRRTVIDEQCE